jgi:hypothetical protein
LHKAQLEGNVITEGSVLASGLNGYPKLMVYNGKSQTNMDDDWGDPNFRKPPYLYHTRLLQCEAPNVISWFITASNYGLN